MPQIFTEILTLMSQLKLLNDTLLRTYDKVLKVDNLNLSANLLCMYTGLVKSHGMVESCYLKIDLPI